MSFDGKILTDHMLKRRLLKDIHELQRKPYPGIELYVLESDMKRACLVLTPEGEKPLHLTLSFTSQYPLIPPHVTLQTKISHPNVFDDRICLNILIADEGYTPAYTLKGICIQILSFFASDTVEQMWGEHGGKVDRKQWQARSQDGFGMNVQTHSFTCKLCGFGDQSKDPSATALSQKLESTSISASAPPAPPAVSDVSSEPSQASMRMQSLPSEIILMILDNLEEEHILTAARAWDGFGRVMRQYNVIRTRELQCFTLRQGFCELELGVGVQVEGRSISSEFDILSREAYERLLVRNSIQGLPFTSWLPLPLAQNHWTRVSKLVQRDIGIIARTASVNGPAENTIYTFMNDVVVRLSTESERLASNAGTATGRSILCHASEKAIESYFHLFHLLLCLACDKPEIARKANTLIASFLAGQRSKDKIPNLGFLLIMILISDTESSETLTTSIIHEAITRSVVWMLNRCGIRMPELSFMERDTISHYRLQKTFEASKTSYRLFMFLDFMRRVVLDSRISTDPHTGETKKLSLAELRDSLFARHGAPPENAAAELATGIKRIHAVKNFREFLQVMGVTPQTAGSFTALLRGTVKASMERGYSKWGLTQEQALSLRLKKEPGVERPEGMAPEKVPRGYSFFPVQQGGGGGNGGRGGRGRGRGR